MKKYLTKSEIELKRGFNIFSINDTIFLKLVYDLPYSSNVNYSKVLTLSFNKNKKRFEFEYKNINKNGFNFFERVVIKTLSMIFNNHFPKDVKHQKISKKDFQKSVEDLKQCELVKRLDKVLVKDKVYEGKRDFHDLCMTVEKIIATK